MKLSVFHKVVFLCLLTVVFCTLVVLFVVSEKRPLPITTVSNPNQSALVEGGKVGEASSVAEAVNINTATAEELETLPGIGEKIAARIIAYREENGAFQDVGQLREVKGIGDKMLQKLLPYIVIE